MIAIISPYTFKSDIKRLTNQIWKLIPMKENKEDWRSQLDTVLVELLGLKNFFCVADERFLILVSKLSGLKDADISFIIYRKTIFECISILQEVSL